MTAPGFTEEWFPAHSQRALSELVRVTSKLDGIVVEIGAWEGRSTVALARAAYPRLVRSCDTWEGSPAEPSAALAAERDVFAQWSANVAAMTLGNVRAHRMGWREFVPSLTEPVALAFIDAEHSYVEVRDNIAALLPHMVPGGIICGDDAHHKPVQDAVEEVLGDAVFVDATLWVWQKPSEALPVSALAEQYAEVAATPSDIYLHLPKMVDLVRTLNAQHVIELGTRTGVSTIAWLHALEATGGRLTSVDIDERPAIGDHDRWTFIQGDDCSDAVLDQLEPADIVFIDTSHLYAHTVRELAAYLPLVRSGGLICLHDTELPIPEGAPPRPLYPVKKAVTEFVQRHGFRWVNFPECWGFAIVSIP